MSSSRLPFVPLLESTLRNLNRVTVWPAGTRYSPVYVSHHGSVSPSYVSTPDGVAMTVPTGPVLSPSPLTLTRVACWAVSCQTSMVPGVVRMSW